ncbi:hypothetical protein [Neorhizobium galegae]|uniref:hypothetical protein n=1 Tax=Neorhizobium galegae TaxID=399 RepID=UPI001F15BBE1|nr:hypothetical protein [Neorhizobium galegae]UIK04107.1 hypothetical protein LZK81_15590 [Neorhizobium galegae]
MKKRASGMRRARGLAMFFVLFAPALALAQDAQDRAGELKAWREQCNDPDPDLRLAYVEKAVAGGDAAIQRICTRLALDSDNADIRNLGLRTAVATLPQIRFSVEIPPQLTAAIKAASGNEKKMAELERSYIMRSWQLMQNGLIFEIDGAEPGTSNSVWYPMVGLNDRNNNYKGKTTIVGSRLTWLGRANLPQGECSLNIQLKAGSELAGTFQCADAWPFAVSAKLL